MIKKYLVTLLLLLSMGAQHKVLPSWEEDIFEVVFYYNRLEVARVSDQGKINTLLKSIGQLKKSGNIPVEILEYYPTPLQNKGLDGKICVYRRGPCEPKINQRLSEEWNFKNSKLEGKSIEFADFEENKTVWNYKNGKLDGVIKVLFYGEKRYSLRTYKNGKLHGPYKEYSSKESLLLEVNYVDGKKEGHEKGYYENGIIKSEINYINGKRDGITRYYYESGKLRNENGYKNGNDPAP